LRIRPEDRTQQNARVTSLGMNFHLGRFHDWLLQE
jgi:hypothetical protein